MSYEEFINTLKENLEPHNPEWINRKDYDIVKLDFHHNFGYTSGENVRDAISCFEKRVIECSVLGDKLNPLEALAVRLLLDSAGLTHELEKGKR